MSEGRKSPTRTPKVSRCKSVACWRQSVTDTSVQCLMSSVQRLGASSQRLFPAMSTCRISVHRLSAKTTCPKYYNVLLLTSVRRQRVGSDSSSTELLVLCSFYNWFASFFDTYIHLECITRGMHIHYLEMGKRAVEIYCKCSLHFYHVLLLQPATALQNRLSEDTVVMLCSKSQVCQKKNLKTVRAVR